MLEWPRDKLTHAGSVTHWQVGSLPAKHCTDCQRETHLFPDLRSLRLLLSLRSHQSSQKKMFQTIFPHHREWNFPRLKGSLAFIRWSVSTSWFLLSVGPFTNLPSTQNGLCYWVHPGGSHRMQGFSSAGNRTLGSFSRAKANPLRKLEREELWQPLLTLATISFLWKQSRHLL